MQSDYYRQMNSVTMNGVKATINFPDTPNPNDKPVLWELVIESGNKKSSIEGYNILAPAVLPPPATGTDDYDSDSDSDTELLPAIIPVPATGTATAAEVAAIIAANNDVNMQYDERENREILMMSIFNKKNLKFI